MPTDAGNGDQKATNATIAKQIDRLDERVGETLSLLRDIDDRQRNDHDRLIGACKQVETNASEIKTLRSVNRAWDFINSLGVAVASWLGVNN